MSRVSKPVVLSLVAVLTLYCFVLPVPLAVASSPPVRCHEHGGGAPSSDGSKMLCCLTGHDVAILQLCILNQPTIAASIAATPEISAHMTALPNAVPTLSEDPPGRIPLRI
jgi:hypothetical protein